MDRRMARKTVNLLAGRLLLGAAGLSARGRTGEEPAVAAGRPWTHGPPFAAPYFPIGVWLQDPQNAPRYRDAGFNLYVGLWQGPTEEQLAALAAAGMPVICAQN